MNNVAPFFSRMSGFLWVFVSFWILGGIALLKWGYKESFLVLNSYHSPFWDAVMPHYTHLGDGVLLGSLFIFFLLSRDKNLALSFLLTLILVTISVYFFKLIVFEGWDRPLRVFKKIPFHFISIRELTHHSFPSGHSAAATAVFGGIAYYFSANHKAWGVLFGILGLIACYSRLYIGVHFLGDLVAGSLLGFCILAGFIIFLYPFLEKNSQNRIKPIKRWPAPFFSFIMSAIFIMAVWRIYAQYYLT